MKKKWNKPSYITMTANNLTSHISASAWSGEIICKHFVLR